MTEQPDEDANTCPHCEGKLTPCQIENPNRYYDPYEGWQGEFWKDAWYCEHCKKVVDIDDIPF